MLGVNRNGVVDATPEEVHAFLGRTGATFPVGYDFLDRFTELRAGAPGSSPASVHLIIDQSGTLAYLSRSYDEQAMLRVIDDLLDSADFIMPSPSKRFAGPSIP